MVNVAKKTAAKRNATSVVTKKPACRTSGKRKKRPSASIVRKRPSASTSCSSSHDPVYVHRHSWLADDVNDDQVEPSNFAIALAVHLNGLHIVPQHVTPHNAQSLLYEAEDDYAHAHHMLNIDSGHARHLLDYMSRALQLAFGSVGNWMNELRFVYNNC